MTVRKVNTVSAILQGWLLLICGLMAGCGSTLAEVSGTVTLDGQPLDSGRVVFHCQGKAPAIANILPGGKFQLQINDRTEIQPGQYIVTVASYDVGKPSVAGNPPPARLITPPKYVRTQTTDLKADVKVGTNQLSFDLISDR